MKYSIRGSLQPSKSESVIRLVNTYTLWRLYTDNILSRETKEQKFIFEVWVKTEADKTKLFNSLRDYINQSGENISWHECTHDENIPLPCEDVETYEGG